MDKSALMKLSYGLYVLGVKNGDGFGGCIVDAVAQISQSDPPNVVLGSNLRNYSNELIKKTGVFTLSILGVDVDPFVIANFGFQSARNESVDKWAHVPHFEKDGLLYLEGAVSYLRLKVKEQQELGSHTLFLCETKDAWLGESIVKPLIYGDYQADMKDATMAAFKAFQEKNQK
ncbi:MAG: flavin reductase family protein [Clostridiales Family XIII bacterium]|jgi:flavin reductase (DIM6/NTAB) family NADH-FMN oxidoreductase RutF|nr:flavin reductase family protein [Clostridiales Family XIII bacterium]